MAIDNTTRLEFRSRDKDLDEDVRTDVRIQKTSDAYFRDRITLSASQSGHVHSFTPTSGVGHLKISSNQDIDLQINQSGTQFGMAASSPFMLITRGAGKNTAEITSVKLWNLAASTAIALVDIIHTD